MGGTPPLPPPIVPSTATAAAATVPLQAVPVDLPDLPPAWQNLLRPAQVAVQISQVQLNSLQLILQSALGPLVVKLPEGMPQALLNSLQQGQALLLQYQPAADGSTAPKGAGQLQLLLPQLSAQNSAQNMAQNSAQNLGQNSPPTGLLQNAQAAPLATATAPFVQWRASEAPLVFVATQLQPQQTAQNNSGLVNLHNAAALGSNQAQLQLAPVLAGEAPRGSEWQRAVLLPNNGGREAVSVLQIGEQEWLVPQRLPQAAGTVFQARLLPIIDAGLGQGKSVSPVLHAAQALQQLLAQPELAPEANTLRQLFLPQIGPRLGVQMLTLLAAARPELRAILGERLMQSLEQNARREMVQTALDELRQASQSSRTMVEVGQNQTGQNQEWRQQAIPFFAGGELQQIHLAVMADGKGDDKAQEDKKPKSTRFIVELNLSRLGLVQIDGFAQTKQLDLFIRSEQPLAPALLQELRQLYTQLLAATGLAGQVGFQTMAQKVQLRPSQTGQNSSV